MTVSVTSSIEHAIPGDYQLRALQQGWRLQRAWHRARLDLIGHVLPPAHEGLILDAAGGSGIVTWNFRERRIVNADMRVSACVATRRHTAGARAVAALVDALPFSTGTFAQAYLLEVIEHLGEQQGVDALREIARVCRPGASFLITTPNYQSHWKLIEYALDRWGPTPQLGDAQHVTRYDAATLRRAAETAGWTVTSLGSFNLVAPVVGVVSADLATRLTAFEASHLRFSGPLLFAVCRRA